MDLLTNDITVSKHFKDTDALPYEQDPNVRSDGLKVRPPAVVRTVYVPAEIEPPRTSAPVLPNKKNGAAVSLRNFKTCDPANNSMKTAPYVNGGVQVNVTSTLTLHGGLETNPLLGTVATFALDTALYTPRLMVHGSATIASGWSVFEYNTAPVTLINLISRTPADETSAIPNVDKYGGGRF